MTLKATCSKKSKKKKDDGNFFTIIIIIIKLLLKMKIRHAILGNNCRKRKKRSDEGVKRS